MVLELAITDNPMLLPANHFMKLRPVSSCVINYRSMQKGVRGNDQILPRMTVPEKHSAQHGLRIASIVINPGVWQKEI
jgi:hypothetical protein